MDFLTWHYTKGIQFYLDMWFSYFRWNLHYFSLSLLLKTLFSPWKRLIDNEKVPGFNPMKIFEQITFNLVSRGIGAVVRITLFVAGTVFFGVIAIVGSVGMMFWLFLPFLGIPIFLIVNKNPEKFMGNLSQKITNSKDLFATLFDNDAGKFLLMRLNIDYKTLSKYTDLSKIKTKVKYTKYEDLITGLVQQKVWKGEFYRKFGLTPEDFILAAFWWDRQMAKLSILESPSVGKPGIGLELLFGYTPTLNRFSTDLSTPLSYSHHLIGREKTVLQMERTLSSGSSVLLVGQPGVGKKTVVLEFARRAIGGLLGEEMSYRRVLELDYNFLLSGSADLNQKKSDLSQILSEAANAGNIIIVIRGIHRLTNSEVEGYDFTDVFQKYFEEKELKIIAISTPIEYERFISKNLRLRKHLHSVEVLPPTKEQAMEILIEFSEKWERLKGSTVLVPVLRKILNESDRYITEIPFPEKAIELLDAVILYCDQKAKKVVTVEDANEILSEKTGISFARLSKSEVKKLDRIEKIIHERLINQETAVSLIGKSLRSKVVGTVKENRPLGSFLFMGPTGVGKTETAKVLSKVYYGSQENILRFDMAEYSGDEGLERLIGSATKNHPGALTTAIKNRPTSLLLLDEIEKSSPEVYNLFLALLDEGVFTDAFGRKINGKHLFVIGTSNAGANYVRKLVTEGVSGQELQKKVINHVLNEGIFSPEFLNRFDGVVVYEPLKPNDLVKIATLLLEDLVVNLKQKGILLNITQEVATKLSEDGYDPAFGARPMKRIVNLILGDLLGRAMLKNELAEGDTVEIVPGSGKDDYSLKKIS